MALEFELDKKEDDEGHGKDFTHGSLIQAGTNCVVRSTSASWVC